MNFVHDAETQFSLSMCYLLRKTFIVPETSNTYLSTFQNLDLIQTDLLDMSFKNIVSTKHQDGGPTIAVVTGASRGLGLAIASKLLDDGFVVICAQRTASVLSSTHSNALNIPLDLAEAQSVEHFIARMISQLPYIDILINNSATCPEDHVFRDQCPPWTEVVRVNFFAQVHLTERLLPLLEASSRCPRVVYISSGDGELVFFAPNLCEELKKLSYQLSVPDLMCAISSFISRTLIKNPNGHQEYVFDILPAYRLSTAALNCYTCVAASRAQKMRSLISFVSVCPADVDTSMHDPSAVVLTPEEAVIKMKCILDPKEVCASGKFLRHGSEID